MTIYIREFRRRGDPLAFQPISVQPIGISPAHVVGVEGTILRVRALDAIDGTPVLNIKPHLAEFAPRGPVTQPAWSREVMTDYYKRGAERRGAASFALLNRLDMPLYLV